MIVEALSSNQYKITLNYDEIKMIQHYKIITNDCRLFEETIRTLLQPAINKLFNGESEVNNGV